MGRVFAIGASGTNPTTSGVDTTGCKLFVASPSYFTGGADPANVTDSGANVWNGLTARFTGVNLKIRLYWCVPTTVGPGHTFSSNGSFASLTVLGFDDTFDASPFDVENGNGSSSAAAVQPGSITPSADNGLVVSVFGYGTGTNDDPAVDASFAIDFSAGGGTGNFRGVIAHEYQTLAAAVNPTWSVTGGNTQVVAAIAAFKVAPSGGGGWGPLLMGERNRLIYGNGGF